MNNRRFRWDRVGGHNGISSFSTLTFNPLSLDDEGEYRCIVSIDSPYLTRSLSALNISRITVNSELNAICIVNFC